MTGLIAAHGRQPQQVGVDLVGDLAAERVESEPPHARVHRRTQASMTPTMSMLPMQAIRSGLPVMPLLSSSAKPTAR